MKSRYKIFFKFLLWLLFFITFTSEFVKIVFELGPVTGHKHLGMANAFFWSSLFLIEMLMAGILIFFFITLHDFFPAFFEYIWVCRIQSIFHQLKINPLVLYPLRKETEPEIYEENLPPA